jgi:hypothetical protein
MSREAFIEYYTKWLRKPENKKSADKIDSIQNEVEFGEFALSQRAESGLDFTKQDIIDVMEASTAKARQQAGLKVDDLPQADKLAQKELGAAAGGYSYGAYSLSSSSLLSSTSTVSLYGSTGSNLLDGGSFSYSTVMCCW